MDKDQTVEVIDLLEDIIGELSGSYVMLKSVFLQIKS